MASLFFWPAPLGLKQGYLVVVGCVTAYVFTYVPEWTTWVLLVGMALYDLWAVLSPGGPLKACPGTPCGGPTWILPGEHFGGPFNLHSRRQASDKKQVRRMHVLTGYCMASTAMLCRFLWV